MTIQELAHLTGLTVRTLHHYDAIGLLSPIRESNGYRNYTDDEVNKLQTILFFKACGFKLQRIQELVSNPTFDQKEALLLQKQFLLKEQKKIQTMLVTLEKTLETIKGNTTMTSQEKFNGFDFSKNPYEAEARERWGNTAVDTSNNHLSSLSENEKQNMQETFSQLFVKLASLRFEDPASEISQQAMTEMYQVFNKSFGVHYSYEAFGNLGSMYVEDERFTQNIDQFGEGLAQYLSQAMQLFAESKKE